MLPYVAPAESTQPLLLCFDGSTDAENAIASAGGLLASRPAMVLAVSEPIRLWQPTDPATVLEAPIAKLLARALELEEIADAAAEEHVNRGVELARAAGFEDARGRVVRGKAWRTICTVAQEIDAAAIVLGARGLSRVKSALLGGVSFAVSVHAERPVLIVHARMASARRAGAEPARAQPGAP